MAGISAYTELESWVVSGILHPSKGVIMQTPGVEFQSLQGIQVEPGRKSPTLLSISSLLPQVKRRSLCQATISFCPHHGQSAAGC